MSKRGQPNPHRDLIVHIQKALTKEHFETLKDEAKSYEYGGFLPGELEKIQNLRDLLEKMEHKGVFKVKNHPKKEADYRKLKELMRKCENEPVFEEIERAEEMLQNIGYVVKKDYPDFGSSGYVAMETEPSPNVNNSRRDDSDATPSDIEAMGIDKDVADGFAYQKGKGYLLFINNFENAGESDKRRKGSHKDKEVIEELFDSDGQYELNFKCVYEKDLTRPQLLELLEKTKKKIAAGKDLYSSFFLIICSHGEQYVLNDADKTSTLEGISTIDKKYITEEELTKPFLGDELKEFNDKPKVFIIQACRSPRRDMPDDMLPNSSEQIVSDSTSTSLSKPVNADLLISYATTKGTKAWRNEDGTWYISDLCKGIKKWYKKKHLLDILVRVNKEVALRTSTEGSAKQMPCQVSTLTKDVWL